MNVMDVLKTLVQLENQRNASIFDSALAKAYNSDDHTSVHAWLEQLEAHRYVQIKRPSGGTMPFWLIKSTQDGRDALQ